MLIPLFLAAFAGAVVQQADTTLPVAAGARLDVRLTSGALTVRTWDRREVRVQSTGAVEVRTTNGTVKVRTDNRWGDGGHMGSGAQDITITMPRDMAIEAEGASMSADLDGVGGEVRLESANGRFRVRGGRQFVRLHTVHGAVTLEDADGRIDLHSTNGSVSATNVAGEIKAYALNGRVALRNVRSGSVEASTVNGTIEYAGTIERGGRYLLNSHAGDVEVAIPTSAGVTLTASTFGGSFESAFPVTLEKMEGGQTLSFTLGDGGAQMELTSFSGTIRLRRP